MSIATTAARLTNKLDDRVRGWAEKGMQHAAILHMNAPRGGENFNAYGQRRSAPGEQPAIEHGELLNRIVNHVHREKLRATIPVNYAPLEWGNDGEYGYVEPRPLGRMVLAFLKEGGESW